MEISLTRKEYDACEFKGVSLSNKKLQHFAFQNCLFKKCSFQEIEFEDCLFEECRFQNCNINLSKFKGSSFSTVKFENSQLIGIDWTITNWGRSKLFTPVDFFESVINYNTFMGLSLAKIKIKKCIARSVDFSEADLNQADCTGSDFTESIFTHTNLSEANFTGASGYSIDVLKNTLKKARFSMPEALSLLYNLDIILEE